MHQTGGASKNSPITCLPYRPSKPTRPTNPAEKAAAGADQAKLSKPHTTHNGDVFKREQAKAGLGSQSADKLGGDVKKGWLESQDSRIGELIEKLKKSVAGQASKGAMGN